MQNLILIPQLLRYPMFRLHPVVAMRQLSKLECPVNIATHSILLNAKGCGDCTRSNYNYVLWRLRVRDSGLLPLPFFYDFFPHPSYAFYLVASAPLGFWVRDPQAVYGPLVISEG
jgi:hypothetical protein